MKDSLIFGGLTFGVGIIVGLGMSPEGTRAVVDNEVVKVTTPTTTEPIIYQDVVCEFDDEIAIVITEDWDENNQIGDRFCVSFDDLVPRRLP